MSNHTPGPWKAKLEDYEDLEWNPDVVDWAKPDPHWSVVTDGRPQNMNLLVIWELDNGGYKEATLEANANLIAAPLICTLR